MKKLLLSILAALTLALPVHAQNTILVVDLAGVFNNLTEVRTQMAKLQSAAEEYQNFLNDKAAKLTEQQKKVDDLNGAVQNPANPQESRDTYKTQLTSAVAELKAMQQDAIKSQQDSQASLENEKETIFKDEYQKIQVVVKDIAKKRNAVLVVNSATVGMLGAVIYNGDNTDITKEVIDKLNASSVSAKTDGGAATTMTPPTLSKPAAGTATK